MTITKEHLRFIDTYIQTMDYARAAQAMGNISKVDAATVGLDLISNVEIQDAIKKRREQLVDAMKAIPMSKEQILAVMMFQYQEANRQGKSKEATDILAQIAQAEGIDLKSIQVEPVKLVINNLDENKL